MLHFNEQLSSQPIRIESKQVIFLFLIVVFSKGNRKHVLCVAKTDRNTYESLGELEKLWKHLPAACVPTAFLGYLQLLQGLI